MTERPRIIDKPDGPEPDLEDADDAPDDDEPEPENDVVEEPAEDDASTTPVDPEGTA